MIQKRLTIKDIATQLHLSTTTVSFVLNGKSRENRIRDNVRDLVLSFVQKNEYIANEQARNLRTGKTNLIGFIVEDISDPFYGKIASRIQEVAYKRGYWIIYHNTKNDIERMHEIICLIGGRKLDGCVLSLPAGVGSSIVEEIRNKNCPAILFDNSVKGAEQQSVEAIADDLINRLLNILEAE
jgi:LacI family transcriptional regulator